MEDLAGSIELPSVNRRRSYAIALGSFGVKGLCAFAITYRLANNLSASDFALWSTMFSFGMILSVADMGVGQLVLTTVHENRIRGIVDRRLMANAVFAMLTLSLMLLILMIGIFSWHDALAGVRWKNLLIALILFRLVMIPAGAFLSALERYYERKVAEAISYVVGAGFVFWGIHARADVSTLLLGLNAIITLGSVGIGVRAHKLGMPRVSPSDVAPADIRVIFAESVPYFVNNVSGLAIYGGFIALSAIVLPPVDIARLSLLHSVLFMHGYQAFELVFRSIQPRMHERALMRRLQGFVLVSYGVALAVAAALGPFVLGRLFRKYTYSPIELAVYATFVFLEVWYLLLTSEMQMRSAMKKNLQWMSIVKAIAFGVILLITAATPGTPTLLFYFSLLVVYSASMAYVGWRVDRRRAA